MAPLVARFVGVYTPEASESVAPSRRPWPPRSLRGDVGGTPAQHEVNQDGVRRPLGGFHPAAARNRIRTSGGALGAHTKHTIEAASAPLRADPPMASEAADALGTMAIPPLALKAPWHVRHARQILYGVASLAAAGVAYFAYYAWSLHTDPLDRSIAARWRADRAPAALAGAAPIAATAHQATTADVVVPAASTSAPAMPRKPQPRASLVKQVDPARAEAATRAPPLARTHAAVTHTRPNDAASDIAVAAVPSSGNDKPRSSGGSTCSAEVTALGLCNPGAERERK
jgi:hypothetical protein